MLCFAHIDTLRDSVASITLKIEALWVEPLYNIKGVPHEQGK